MKVAVIGLGVEGKKALHSLLNHGYQVYASDLNERLVIESDHDFELELGNHDWDEINSADAVILSPSLWNFEVFKKLKSNNKLFTDIINNHKSIFTIGVTGTNGKTTTCLMIKEILQNYGFKILIGGNAGGGFEGYTELILEASQKNYDMLIVEVCDMTLDFCAYNFDFDLIVVTNLGHDHLNVHKTMQNYQKSLQRFLKEKEAVLNINDELLSGMDDYSKDAFFFDYYPEDLNLFGKFNRQNAAAAAEVAKILNIPKENINESLKSFTPVPGRIDELNIGKSKIVIGKTDNISAITAVISEEKFDVVILGTPRRNEYWRYDILKEASKINPQLIGLFPGLDDTTNKAEELLIKYGYHGSIKILNDIKEVIEFTIDCVKKDSIIFIGGNGQNKIMNIKEILEQCE
ncbi:MAG: Mur ligase family protein [Methanobacterium sp.]